MMTLISFIAMKRIIMGVDTSDVPVLRRPRSLRGIDSKKSIIASNRCLMKKVTKSSAKLSSKMTMKANLKSHPKMRLKATKLVKSLRILSRLNLRGSLSYIWMVLSLGRKTPIPRGTKIPL
jgi:hypothetical protein